MYKRTVETVRALGVAILGLCAGTLVAPQAHAAETWVAIAYSPTAKASGNGMSSLGIIEAGDAAMTMCKNRGGTDCEVKVSSRVGCAALAINGSNWYPGAADTRGDAEAEALAGTGGGTIQESICLPGMPAAPAPVPASQFKTASVTGDVDIYDVPGGVGNVVGMLEGGEGQQVQAKCREDTWCEVSGQGWVWGDFLKF